MVTITAASHLRRSATAIVDRDRLRILGFVCKNLSSINYSLKKRCGRSNRNFSYRTFAASGMSKV
jgi:hypothetical protein